MVVSMKKFLTESEYIDYNTKIIRETAAKLFSNIADPVMIAKRAYEYVRDDIAHASDIGSDIVTVKASEVLQYGVGICHTKSILLAALLRYKGIPTGFCYQHLTLAEDESIGYCLHGYNAIYVDNHWIKVDARGNKEGVTAAFSLKDPKIAFYPREDYDEYDIKGIFAEPEPAMMEVLSSTDSLDYVYKHMPDKISRNADII